MSARFRLNVIRIISNIKGKLTHPLFTVIELLPEVVEHIVAMLNPSRWEISEELYKQIQMFKQNLDAAMMDHGNGTEYRHYCYYLFNLSYNVRPDGTDQEMVKVFKKYHAMLMATKWELKIRKKRKSLATRNINGHILEQLHEFVINMGFELVGHTKESCPTNVYCMDTNMHEKLDPQKMLIKGINDVHGPNDGMYVDPRASVPPPVKNNPFGNGYVDTKAVLKDKGLKILNHSTVYGFAQGLDETYSIVFAVQFQSHDSLHEVEKEVVGVFVDFLPKVAAHTYEVKVNGTQNNEEDKHNPTHYIDLYNNQEIINSAWMIMQESLSPRTVLMTINTLADTAVPMFGLHSSNIAIHS
ncbi:hypothetical protein FRC11_005434 [Ceratobasidium sp. 423]|nr:hypothetical protein FRC11_005434 [Ceratobasidium sp. 423]